MAAIPSTSELTARISKIRDKIGRSGVGVLDVNMKDEHGKTLFYYAALLDIPGIIELFAKYHPELGELTDDEYESLSPAMRKLLAAKGYDLSSHVGIPGTPIYLLQGHGYVTPGVDPKPLPEGVIWIESALCGEVGWAGDEGDLVNNKRKVQTFFDTTPMPTTNEEKVAYRKRFNVLLKSQVYSIKFPGDPFYEGRNSLFRFFPDAKSYSISGIVPLREFDRKDLGLKEDKKATLSNSTLSEMFSKSVYPTKAEALAAYEKDREFKQYDLSYHTFLLDLASGAGTYRIAKPSNEKPVVIFQLGCRVTFAGPNRHKANPMRTFSIRRNANVLGAMTKEELTDPTATELGNRLLFYITHRQVERVEEYLKQLERVMPTAKERKAFLETKLERRKGVPASAMDLARIGLNSRDRNDEMYFYSAYKGPRSKYINKIEYLLLKTVRDDGGITKWEMTLPEAAALGDYDRVYELLLDNGFDDIDAVDDKGKTALYYAIKDKEWDAIDQLLDMGADLNAETPEGKTLLDCAIEEGDPDVIAALLDEQSATLPRAAAAGKFDLVLELLTADGVDVDKVDRKGHTALYYAKQAGNKNVIEKLIKAGAKRGVDSSVGKPVGASLPNHNLNSKLNSAFRIATEGDDIDAEDEEGKTALYYAIKFIEEDVVDQLIQLGADPNHENQHGETLLDLAIKEDDSDPRDIIDSLLDLDVPIETAIPKAAAAGKFGLVLQLLNDDRYYLGGLDEVDKNGKTALYYALKKYKPDVIKKLLEKGANVEDDELQTLVDLAILESNIVGLNLLLNVGVPVQAALPKAAAAGDFGLVLRLLNDDRYYLAGLDEIDEHGKTLLDYALKAKAKGVKGGDLEAVIAELRRKGAKEPVAKGGTRKAKRGARRTRKAKRGGQRTRKGRSLRRILRRHRTLKRK